MNLALLSPKVWIEMALVAALAFGGWWLYRHVKGIGYAEAKAEQAVIDKARDDGMLKQVLQGVQDTAGLQAQANATQGEVNAKLIANTGRISSIVVGLRDRPDRPSAGSVPPSAGTGAGQPGCTGAGLYKSDSTVLIRFAAATAELQTRLKACYAAYDAVAAKLNKTP